MGKWKTRRPFEIHKCTVKVNIGNRTVQIEVNLLFFVILIFMLISGYIFKYLMVLFSIFVHEFAHGLSAILLGRNITKIGFLPVGLSISVEEETYDDTWKSVLISLGGPLTNLMLLMPFLAEGQAGIARSDNQYFFIQVNACLAAFNMIPVLPLDGGKIVRRILTRKLGLLSAARHSRRLSLILSLMLIVLGIVQLINSLNNFSILFIGIYLVFYLKSESMEAALMNMKDIFYRRNRLLKKGIYPARDLVVIKSMHIGDVLKFMDFDRFHLVHVLDDDLKLLKTLTEQQVIDGLLKYNPQLTFDEFVKNQIL